MTARIGMHYIVLKIQLLKWIPVVFYRTSTVSRGSFFDIEQITVGCV